MGDLMRRRFALLAEMPNLYTGGDVVFTKNNYKLYITLPMGVYRLSAAVTSTDTDAAVCLVRFMADENTEASTERDPKIERSTAGESHSLIFHCTASVTLLYLYSSENYIKGSGDTAAYRNIRIERIG